MNWYGYNDILYVLIFIYPHFSRKYSYNRMLMLATPSPPPLFLQKHPYSSAWPRMFEWLVSLGAASCPGLAQLSPAPLLDSLLRTDELTWATKTPWVGSVFLRGLYITGFFNWVSRGYNYHLGLYKWLFFGFFFRLLRILMAREIDGFMIHVERYLPGRR